MYPQAYIDYLVYFHTNRDFFECHEVLEEYWKKFDRDQIWVGLIQIAVGLYHYRRENYVGANKVITNAINILQKESLQSLGLDKEKLLSELMKLREKINNENKFIDIDLPIIDKNLQQQCETICQIKNLHWGSPSKLNHEEIVHKHKLRDRSEVIKERQKKLQQKRGK